MISTTGRLFWEQAISERLAVNYATLEKTTHIRRNIYELEYDIDVGVGGVQCECRFVFGNIRLENLARASRINFKFTIDFISFRVSE